MRFSFLRVVPLAFLAFAAASCSQTECAPGEIKPGSTCYTGPEGTAGKGICKTGHFTCGADGKWGSNCNGEVKPAQEVCNGLDDNCDGNIDEELTNLCGGCVLPLTNPAGQQASPGDACGECQALTCDGAEKLRCMTAEETAGSPCKTADGCAGAFRCDSTGKVTCVGDSRNKCGLCGGPAINDLGNTCDTLDGCTGGTRVCNASGTGTVCFGPKKNNCGECGKPDVPRLGFSCQAANGCEGSIQCDGSCATTLFRNECGVCVAAGTPAMPSDKLPGQSCLSNGTPATGGACPGTYVCDPSGLRTVCNAPPRNNCGACGQPNVEGLNTSCVGNDTCQGTWKCNPDGSGNKVCLNAVNTTPHKNQCGVCVTASAPDITDPGKLPGTTLNVVYTYGTAPNQLSCPSIYLCNGGVPAIMPLKQNACGLCPPVPSPTTPYSPSGITAPLTGSAPGTVCTAANGCPGTFTCDTVGDNTVSPAIAPKARTLCTTPQTKNQCGFCGNPPPALDADKLPGSPTTFTDAGNHTCASKYLCKADGTTAVQPTALSACGQCPTQLPADTAAFSATPVAGTLSAGSGAPTTPCNSSNGCPSTWTCKADHTGTECLQAQAKNNCGACGAADVALGSCIASNGCPGTLACAANGTSAVCNGQVKNNCEVCGDPNVQGIGEPCWDAANNCSSVQSCEPDPTRPGHARATCPAKPKNVCGTCGGTPIASDKTPNTPCFNAANCPGMWTCDASGNTTKCSGGTFDGTQTCTDAASGCTGYRRCLNGDDSISGCDACIATHLVISEMSLAGSGANDSFVELYNPSSAPISLSGMTLWYYEQATTTWTQLVAFGSSASVGAGGFFLVAHTSVTTPTPDATYSPTLAAAGGAVVLVNGTTEPTGAAGSVDALGWGNSTVVEVAAGAAPDTGRSLERKAYPNSTSAWLATGGLHHYLGNGFDSGKNSYDFVTRTAREPQNTASPAETK